MKEKKWLAAALPLSLLLGTVAFGLWRGGLETSLWIDETASLVLASRPAAAIVDLSAIDTNPPGYFLVLKAWLRAGRFLGLEPGIFWARLLGTLALLALIVVCWREGRRWLGPRSGGALGLAVAGSSYAAILANDARGYCLASVALFACFIILLRSHEALLDGGDPRAYRRWLLYVLCAQAALWTHVLSLLALASFGLLWLGLIFYRRAWRSNFARVGASAHLLTALLFLPWLLHLRGQAAALKSGAPAWMTPATGSNLLSVFWYWYPFGRLGDPFHPPMRFLPVLGLLSGLVPLVAALALARRDKPREYPPERAGRLGLIAIAGIGVAIAFVLALWCLQRFGAASVFHAPRYPALAAALWAAGLVGLAGFAGSRTRSPSAWTWILLSPWLLCCVAGRAWVPRIETSGGLRGGLASLASGPPPGSSLYVMPSELIPFYRHTLAPYSVRRIEDLPCGMRGAREVWVLNANFWRLFDRSRDLIVQRFLDDRSVAETVDRTSFPETTSDYRLFHLVSPRQEAAMAFCRRGLQPTGRDIPAGAVSVALPEDQRFTNGWSFPEVSAEGALYRWAASSQAVIHFDRSLPSGDFVLHYRGYRSDQPQTSAPMTLELNGITLRFQQAAGEVSQQLTLHLERPLHSPRLVVRHPVWSPIGSASADTRQLASAFLYAWLERTRR